MAKKTIVVKQIASAARRTKKVAEILKKPEAETVEA